MDKQTKAKTADDLSKDSIRDFYGDHTNQEVLDEGMRFLEKACPPEEFGESEDCEGVQDILHEQYYRISDLEAQNKKLKEALEKVKYVKSGSETSDLSYCRHVAEQALKEDKDHG